MLVIARAYKDRPLLRTVVGTAPSVIFLHNQDALGVDGAVDKSGVGFPRDCVFPYDSTVYQALLAQWEAGNAAELARLWDELAPIRELVDA